MAYRTQKFLLLAAFTAYFFIGMFSQTIPGGEVYPFFSWSLFSTIPNERAVYTMEINRIGDIVYNPPLPFSETKFLFDTIHQAPTEYTTFISKLGLALDKDDEQNIDLYRAKLERIFPETAYSYTVFRVEYNPVEHWKSGTYTLQRALGTFDQRDRLAL